MNAIFQPIRGVFMDLGLGSLIEKLETYFGRNVTGAFLGLVLLAASIWCLRLVFTFVGDVIDFFGDDGSKWQQSDTVNLLASAVFVFVFSVLLNTVIARWVAHKGGRQFDRVEELISRADRYHKDLSHDVDALTKWYEEFGDKLEGVPPPPKIKDREHDEV